MNLKNLPCYKDDRGSIQMVFENCDVKSISRIESNPGTWRARHSHDEIHWCEVLEGQIEYYEAFLKDGKVVGKPTKQVFNKGDIFENIPGSFHEMVFNSHTVFNCYATLGRAQSDYEKGLYRDLSLSLKDIYDNWDKPDLRNFDK